MDIVRTGNTHDDFSRLSGALDEELRRRYGADDGNNAVDPVDTAVIGYVNGEPAACGCFRALGGDAVEMKRIYVAAEHRRKGFGREVLVALEAWAAELGFASAVLGTGRGQPEAMSLYSGMGYSIPEKFGPYIGLENSVCMKKALSGRQDRTGLRVACPAPGAG